MGAVSVSAKPVAII